MKESLEVKESNRVIKDHISIHMPKAPGLELYGKFSSGISSHECVILQPE